MLESVKCVSSSIPSWVSHNHSSFRNFIHLICRQDNDFIHISNLDKKHFIFWMPRNNSKPGCKWKEEKRRIIIQNGYRHVYRQRQFADFIFLFIWFCWIFACGDRFAIYNFSIMTKGGQRHHVIQHTLQLTTSLFSIIMPTCKLLIVDYVKIYIYIQFIIVLEILIADKKKYMKIDFIFFFLAFWQPISVTTSKKGKTCI